MLPLMLCNETQKYRDIYLIFKKMKIGLQSNEWEMIWPKMELGLFCLWCEWEKKTGKKIDYLALSSIWISVD